MRDIEGYEGLYAVTSCGEVWSYKKNGFLKQSSTNGYLRVMLYKNGNGKRYQVHRLVAYAFLQKEIGKDIVNHKDENPKNNCVNNLEWCTQQYNITYSMIRHKYKRNNQKRCTCLEAGEKFNEPLDIARKFNVGYWRVTKCCRDQNENINGYHFMYV